MKNTVLEDGIPQPSKVLEEQIREAFDQRMKALAEALYAAVPGARELNEDLIRDPSPENIEKARLLAEGWIIKEYIDRKGAYTHFVVERKKV